MKKKTTTKARTKKIKTATLPTHVNFVLDETGSMALMYDEVISGFNKYIETLKGDGQTYTFSLIKFDSTKREHLKRMRDVIAKKAVGHFTGKRPLVYSLKGKP